MTVPPEHVSLARRHLMSWGTGRDDLISRPDDAQGTATIVLDSAEHLDAVLGSPLVGEGSLVLYPGSAADQHVTAPDGVVVVPFEGEVDEPGADVAVGDDFYLQVQDYASSAFVSVIGPTLVRFFEQADFDAYVDEADRAYTDGEFPAFLVDPSVQVADLEAVSGLARGDGPAVRLHVDAAGRLGTAPAGLRFAEVTDSWESVTAAWHERSAEAPGALQLGRVVDEAHRLDQLGRRPWLGRYLVVCEALRRLVRHGVPAFRVSGFGHRLGEGVGDADLTEATLPVVVWTPDKAYVSTPSGRVFSVSLEFGKVLEHVLGSGSVDAARAALPGATLDAVVDQCAANGVLLPSTWGAVGHRTPDEVPV